MSGVVEGEDAGALPEGWVWARLGELGEWYGGGTPSKSRPELWEGGTIPWLSPKDMGQEITSQTRDHITEAALTESPVRLVPAGSVAIVTRSGVLEHSVPVTLTSVATTLNQDMKAVAPHQGIRGQWIAWGLRAFERKILDKCRKAGTTVASLSTPALMELPFPVPPLAEQHRIVEALEDYLSRLDAGQEFLRKTRLKGRTLERAAISRAMQGDFGAEHRGNSVLSLVAQNQSEVSESEDPLQGNPQDGDNEAVTIAIPPRWTMQRLGNLATAIEYGTSSKAHAERADHDIPVIRMGNIQDGALDMTNLKYLPGSHPDSTKLLLQDGDILFNRTNSAELVGKSAVYRSHLGPATFASYLIRCKLAEGVEPDWVNMCINSPYGRRYIKSVASQQVGQANVNGKKLAAFPIPLPPHEEQLQILARVSSWRDSVSSATRTAATLQSRAHHLRESLLHHAFTGRLVPQDPDDEPASALLARIQEERAAREKSKPKRTRRAGTGTRAKRAVPAARTRTPGPPPAASSAPLPANAVQPTFDVFEDQTTGRHQAPNQDETQDAAK